MDDIPDISFSKKNDLLLCRGCLTTEVRLYDMRKNRLMEAYSTLLNTAVQDVEDLPHYLCSFCTAFLLKCDTFRNKCIDARVALRNPTNAYVKEIGFPNFSQSSVQTNNIDKPYENFNYPDDFHVSDKEEANDVCFTNNLTNNAYVNSEINSLLNKILKSDQDAGRINDLIKEFKFYLDCDEFKKSDNNIDMHKMDQLAEIIKNIQYSNQTKDNLLELLEVCNKQKVTRTSNRKSKIETVVSNDLTKFKFEYPIISDSMHDAVTNEDYLLNNMTSDIKKEVEMIDDKFEYTGEMNDISSDTEDEMVIVDLEMDSNQSKCKLTSSDVKTKDYEEIKNRKPKTYPEKRVVSQLCNMIETDLNEDEQLQEIEDRKNSDSYLQAQYKCDFCYKGFRTAESFKTHMLLHDDKSGKYVCDLCHSHFVNKYRLKKHQYNHSKRYTCKDCGYVTKFIHCPFVKIISQNISQAKEHYNLHSGVKNKCKHCGKELRCQSNYYFHLKTCHPTCDELIRCEICGESCNGPLGYKIHEKRAHKEMFSSECYCSGCDTQFYCSDAFKAHQGTAGLCITTHKYCVRCGMAFDTEELLKEHEIEQRKPRTMFKCKLCDKIFKGHMALKRHQLHHSLKNTRQHVCEICGNVLSNGNNLKQHYQNVHSTETPFKCTECHKSYRCALSLKMHNMRTHTGERPYKCKICPKTFSNCANMKRHELVHTGERPHSCDLCGKRFQTAYNARAHVQAVHNNIPRAPSMRQRNIIN